MNVLGEPIDERGEISKKSQPHLINVSHSANLSWQYVLAVVQRPNITYLFTEMHRLWLI